MVIFQKNKATPLRKYVRAYNLIFPSVSAGILALFFNFSARAQCPISSQIYKDLLLVQKNTSLKDTEKLKQFVGLQKVFDKCHLNKDSVYAQILHRIGALQFTAGNINESISYALASVKINTLRQKESDRKFAGKSYCNLGYYYAELKRYKDALNYYDLCVETGNYYKDSLTLAYVIFARNARAHICFKTGDYHKAVEEATLGLSTAAFIKNSTGTASLLIERAQAFAAVQNINAASRDVNAAFALIVKDDYAAFANKYKIQALISEAASNYTEALAYHKKAVLARSKAHDTFNLAGDYLDAGNTIRNETITSHESDFSKAANYYAKALALAQKCGNDGIAIKAFNNLASIDFRTKKYASALTGYHNSLLQTVPSFKNNNALYNPSHRQCNTTSDKNFLSLLLANKAECLLSLYKETYDKQYLVAAINTALLTDSVITDMRHEQTGDQIKLYWRNETREFFTTAIEACYQAKNARLAFYFMEKSRAVLLNDKLNQLGASAQLPAFELAEEQKLQINVFACQQQVARLKESDPLYRDKELNFFSAKEALNRYINTLEVKYPLYHQYKYADAVPALPQLQQYIAGSQQTFVHYFISDTAIYMLAIGPSVSKLIKQSRKNFTTELSHFLQMCSNRSLLNNDYRSFALLAYNLYETLFKPLALPHGRVIICNDAIMIPFEALTTQLNGNDFLVKNYRFSYVYSARFLLKKFNNPAGRGNFLGVAPVSYASYLSVPPLKQSGAALSQSSSHYSNNKLIINTEANRKNLLQELPQFTIVAILSHARADSTDSEPLLFMSDSIVRLSELQLLYNPSTELVVLSACQTNAGKIATGEGIFSLARGFASAGIPAVTATLWKADEGAIYTITDIFLKNISQGMRKDDALQLAKLSFMHNGSAKNLLPYYWANMILAGNGAPVELRGSHNKIWWFAGLFLAIAVVLTYALHNRRK